MKCNNIIEGGIAAVLAFSCLVASAASRTWINFTPNTPATAYDWNTPGNWENGDVGGEGDAVTILPTAKVYIRVPDGGVTVNKMKGDKNNANAILIGGPITLKSSGSTIAEWTTAAPTYCDIIIPESETLKPELDNLDIRCRIINRSSVYLITRNGNLFFHYDYFATSAGETRVVDLVEEGTLGLAGGVLTIYGPEGAAAVSGTWRLVEGSPYATRVSSTAHKLVAGTTVTSEGNLLSGTFLKRVFDNATIELSEPAATSGDVTLSFAAFTANFTARLPRRTYQHGSYGYFLVRKYRAQDVCRLVLDDYYATQSALCTLYGGFSYDTQSNNGTLVFRKVTVGNKPVRFDMYALNIEFAGAADTGVTTLPDDFSLVMTRSLTTHMLVTNNITGVVNVMTNFHGTVAKDGAGLLKIGLGDAANEGSLVVNGGTLQIMRNASVGNGALSVNGLTINSGATFVLPEGGMTVKTLSFESGATLSGPGELIVENGTAELLSSLPGLTRFGGATVRVKSLGEADALQLTEPSHDAPAGHPAFWLDASRPDTVTTNASGGVTRWDDCRVGEPMFCTNIASACPTYVYGDTMRKKYVKISREGNASTLADTQVLVWSVPIEGIKAVFLVQDPTDFGGEILGRTVARCPNSHYASNGGPYYRSTASLSWSQPLVVNSTETPNCVRYGRFFLNGIEVNGAKTGYLGAFMQLVEHHVNTNYDASATYHDLVCDAFGTGCGSDLKWKCNMRIAEYVIYTNSLTYAERLQTAQYLCRKWFGRNVYWSVADGSFELDGSAAAANGDAIDVAAGEEASAGTVSSGTLVKDGGGTLYVESLSVGGLDVRGGDVLVAASGREYDVPRDAWLHVDATETSTIVCTNKRSSLAVHSWADVNGIGRSLHSIRQQRDPSSNGWPLYNPASTINGHACVDIGARQTGDSGGLVVFEPDGKMSPDQDQAYTSMDAPELKTFFVVYDSTAGGGCILGGVGSDFPKKGMPRMWYSDTDRPNPYPICYSPNNSTTLGQVLLISNACENGTAQFIRNGVATNPCVALFLGGPERMSFRLGTGRKCAVFGAYGGSAIRGDYFGGLKYGEIICFERALSDAEVSRVDAYLAKKWFDIDTPGYGARSVGALSVASGAKVTLLGEGALSATSLAGGGTVDGDIALSTGGGIELEIGSDGSLPCLAISGAADLSSGGTVTVTGRFRDLRPGAYTILSSSSLSFGGDWDVSAATASRTFELVRVGDSLVLMVFKRGSVLIFR